MKLNFIKVNPTENMTVFILDPLPRTAHASVARSILSYGCLHAEQVGFIEPPTHDLAGLRLQMMGGEFCGNATRALAAVAVNRGYPSVEKHGESYSVDIEVSGAPTPLPCTVSIIGTNRYSVSAEMPLFEFIQPISVPFENQDYSGIFVRFPGISHIIFHTTEVQLKEGFLEAVLKALPEPCTDALGLMLFNESKCFLTPVVYTPETNSTVWERGCGSGTAALAAALAFESRSSVWMPIHQPGGILDVAAEWSHNTVCRIVLSGPVTIVSEGSVEC